MNERQREYAAFLNNMDVRLGAFVLADLPESVQQKDGTKARFPKDFTAQALPMVEQFVLSKFPTTDEVVAPENRRFVEGLIRYLGETYLRGVGGSWDHDEETGNGMPFIRPDTTEGPNRGEPIPLLAVILTAVDQRNGRIFAGVLAKALQAFGEEGKPKRVCTGMAIGMLNETNSSRDEVEFLSRFVGTIEPGIAAWTKEQAKPEVWTFDRDSLLRLGKQIAVRYDTAEEMTEEDETPYTAGALRFIGETLRRHGMGRWRYGADTEADDPRRRQPYVRFLISEDNLDIVPWQLLRAALEDTEAIATAFDEVIERRKAELAARTTETTADSAAAETTSAVDRAEIGD